MDSESENRVETEEQKKKSNAFLVGLALNLGRAARTAKTGLEAIGATASRVGSGVKGKKKSPPTSEEEVDEGSSPAEEDDDSKPKEKRKDKKKKE